jgi:ribosomal protein L7/L12
MSKRFARTAVDAINRSNATAEFLVLIFCGLQAVWPRGCYWDALDQILDQNITDDEEAKRVVDHLMQYGKDVELREGFDAWDAAEQVAIRIIGNRDLRFAEGDYNAVLNDIGDDHGALLEAICELSGRTQQEARDLIECVTDDIKPAVNSRDLSRVEAERWARRLEAAGASVAVV